MPNTPGHKADMFGLARSRMAAGKKSWEHTINLGGVFHNESLTFTDRRDAIVRILRASKWVRDTDEFGRLAEVVDNVADAEDVTEFDGWWDELYDLADYDRVWINTH
jgi:hypothetical protein